MNRIFLSALNPTYRMSYFCFGLNWTVVVRLRTSRRKQKMMKSKVLSFFLLLSNASSYPEIWPPNGRLTPNNYLPPTKCRYEQETVHEDVVEEICTTEHREECKTEVVLIEEKQVVKNCAEVVEESCTNITVVEEIEQCRTEVEEVCEACPIIKKKCDETYETQIKEECSYETVFDKKCSRSYSVTYKEECKLVTENDCKFFGKFLCEKRDKVKCQKVPQFPSQRCLTVPRLEKHCTKVPVQSPAKKCKTEQRMDCEYKQCKEVSNNVCKKVPVETKRESCEDVTKNVCEDEIIIKPVEKLNEICEQLPEKVCTNKKFKRQKLVPKRICKELKKIDTAKNQ